jgi:uncharacterized protein YjfI (DUF2170 family)
MRDVNVLVPHSDLLVMLLLKGTQPSIKHKLIPVSTNEEHQCVHRCMHISNEISPLSQVGAT